MEMKNPASAIKDGAKAINILVKILFTSENLDFREEDIRSLLTVLFFWIAKAVVIAQMQTFTSLV